MYDLQIKDNCNLAVSVNQTKWVVLKLHIGFLGQLGGRNLIKKIKAYFKKKQLQGVTVEEFYQ